MHPVCVRIIDVSERLAELANRYHLCGSFRIGDDQRSRLLVLSIFRSRLIHTGKMNYKTKSVVVAVGTSFLKDWGSPWICLLKYGVTQHSVESQWCREIILSCNSLWEIPPRWTVDSLVNHSEILMWASHLNILYRPSIVRMWRKRSDCFRLRWHLLVYCACNW